MYDAVMARILGDGDPPESGDGQPIATAVAFRAIASQLGGLTDAERSLLDDWLARVIAAA
jgi:hypothetical protein